MSDWRSRGAVTIAEAARILSVSQATVRRHFDGRLVTIGKRPRVPVRALLEELGEAREIERQPARREGRHVQADRIVRQIRAGRR